MKLFFIVCLGSEIYVIGGLQNNHVQRLAVSLSGKVTEQLDGGPQVPVDSLLGASAIMDDSHTLITVIGGMTSLNGTVKCNLVWILDTQHTSPNWISGPNLLIGKYKHCSCRLGPIIYVITGSSCSDVLKSSVEMLDTSQTSAQWTQTQAYPMSLYGTACVVVGNEVWVSGGFTKSKTNINNVYSWNSVTWQARPSMLTARRGHSMVTYGGQIWVISGWYEPSVEVFEIGNNTWHVLSLLPMWRGYGGSSVLLDTMAILVAGKGPSGFLSAISIMNITTGTSSLSPVTISQPVYYCAVVHVIP